VNPECLSRRFVVLCNPENRRLAYFQSALSKCGIPCAEVVAYRDFLQGRVDIRTVITPQSVLRIESPGENFEVERALLALGADEDDGGTPIPRLTQAQIAQLSLDKGRISHTAQWFLGFRAALWKVKNQMAEAGSTALMNDPDEILTMFDKPVCHATLESSGIAVPAALPRIGSFEELLQSMRARGWCRAFIKPAFGSSASGVIGLGLHGTKMAAYSSVELVKRNGEVILYNSMRIRRYEDHREIAQMIDLLCRDRVHIERWIPKAQVHGCSFDLRVVVIGRRATHTVVRTSSSPITNLHLGNKRGNVSEIQHRMGQENWANALESCERAMQCLPKTHHAGVDLAVQIGFHRHAVLEVNAFGDLLPNVLADGLDTYATELARFGSIPESVAA
jgi:glutathione synthase/RimK-type ligase-like ATP-grasp enzyme